MLNKVRNKRFWYTSAGLIVTVLVLYIIEFTFVSVNTRNRAIIGTALQLATGFIIGVDQVVASWHFKNSKDIWDFLAKTRMRIALFVCIILSLMAVLYWLGMSEGASISPLTVYGAIGALALLYYPYIYGIEKVVKLLENGRGLADPSTKESSVLWGNVILFGVSAIVIVLSGLFIKPLPGQWASIIWWLMVSYFIMPTTIFSLLFLLIVGSISLFTLMRNKIKRSVFWLVLLGLWSWGGLLLLVDVLTS
ncbi:hypothetical protein ACFLWS_07225 [Chloroflexota bacterium]